VKNKLLLIFFIYLVLLSCSNGNDVITGQTSNNDSLKDINKSEWLIPFNQVKDGGPGKDGIPSIDNPRFLSVTNSTFLNDSDLIVGIVNGDEAKAYPHSILDWHEIVNDKVDQDFISISYCPLTGTAFGWKSNVDGKKSSFGVSGLLYNANLILYDRVTNSNWSQLKLQCVNGPMINNEPSLVNVVETNWGTWKKLYPDSQVLSNETGFDRNYEKYPYGDYKTNQDLLIFFATPLNNALPKKERVFAILNGAKSKVYRFSKFGNGSAIKDIFMDDDYLVVGNSDVINSFKLSSDYKDLDFEYDFNNTEVFFKDNEGNKWSIFGEAIEGPRKGQILDKSKSVVSYWFAIGAFYPNPEIY